MLVAIPHPFRPFRRQADDLLLGREVLDREVIDLHRPRVVRANEVLVDPARAWRVVGVDLLARLVPDGVLDADHRRLARVVPADLARICAALPPRQAAALLATLDEARAADTLALPPQPRQGAVLATLDSDRAARIAA